jgi:hypothetical protein
VNDLADQFAVAPQAEGIAIGIEQVGKRLQLIPLILVVRVREFPWIGALARRLDFNEADKGVADGDGIIRACLEMRKRRFANEVDSLCR